MSAADVYRQNVIDVLGKASVRQLLAKYNTEGHTIDYSYVHKVRKGIQTPGIDKSEQLVEMLRLLPGREWIEYWMFFVPNYFRIHTINALTEQKFTQQHFDDIIKELLETVHQFKILNLDKKQFEQVTEVARFVYNKKQNTQD